MNFRDTYLLLCLREYMYTNNNTNELLNIRVELKYVFKKNQF